LFAFFNSWRRARILRRSTLDAALWSRVCAELSMLQGLDEHALKRLRDWVILFLHRKQISAAAGLSIDDEVRYHIAAQACLLVLALDIDHYAGWSEVIVYPNEFVPRREHIDEAGVVHVSRHPLAGEAWPHGPVILSWADARSSVMRDGANVVIHEFAHKLDMRNGEANGLPPLHAGMVRAHWAQAFGAAYEDFCRRVDAGEDTAIDPYAGESPAEFFAVLSEVFFETPSVLKQCYPAVYEQMRLFYKQDPSMRLPN
jgi:MtfA peptidase